MNSPDKNRTDWQRIVGLARPERVTLIAGTLALFVSTGTSLVAPSLVGYLVDGVSEGTGREGINRAAIWLLVVFGVSGFATALRSYWFTVAGERVVARLRGRLYAVILREVAFFDERRTGELTNRLASDTAVLQNAVTVNLSMALRYALQAVGAIGILLWTSWQLTLLMLAVVPVVAIGAAVYGRLVRKVSRQVQDALAQASEVAEETIAGVRTVRAFARESSEIARYEKAVWTKAFNWRNTVRGWERSFLAALVLRGTAPLRPCCGTVASCSARGSSLLGR